LSLFIPLQRMKNIIVFIIGSLLLSNCARQGSLVGGAKDTTPPGIDSLNSTPNYQTMFNKNNVELAFDEWVVLKDVAKEILVSPPLEKRPTFTIKKKSVVVDFGEKPVFRPNTTYTINFGNAVRDLHEGNPAKDLRYVFSTGPVIDSLKVEGIATDALTGEPIENATVMLYDQMYDSVIVKEKPYYFARTDKSGQFSIKNVKGGTFKMVAIDEGQTADLKWNSGSERIGFPTQPLLLNDSVGGRLYVPVSLFKNQSIVKTTDKNALQYGVVRIGWTGTPPADQGIVIGEKALEAGIQYKIENYRDTTLLWYDFPKDTATIPWSLTIKDTTNKVAVKAFKRTEFELRHRLRPLEEGGGGIGGGGRGRGGKAAPPPRPTLLPLKNIPILPGRTGSLKFNFPVVAVDTAKWVVNKDSLPFRAFTIRPDSTQSRVLNVSGNWKPGTTLTVTILPGGISDYYGLSNVDTIPYTITVMTDKQLGTLVLTVEETKPGVSYVLEILNGTTLEQERKFTATEAKTTFKFGEMLAGGYTAKLTEDLNANGRWDTGDYFEHRQPELIFTKKLEPLRANWELEASIKAAKEDVKRK